MEPVSLPEDSDEVCKRAEALVAELSGRDDVHKWEAMERIYLSLAAGPLEQRALRQSVLGLLRKRFPGSRRVQWLELLETECEGLLKSAYQEYRKMGPTEALARKRIVALHIKQGNVAHAIQELCSYLELFQADAAAWRELRDLYAGERLWKKALFCSEEVLLAYPQNAAVKCRHADLLREMGDDLLARKYYALAAESILAAHEEEGNRLVLAEALRGIRQCIDEKHKNPALLAWVETKLTEMKLA